MLTDEIIDDVAIPLGVDELDEIDSLPIPIFLLKYPGEFLILVLVNTRLSLPGYKQG